ncbi:MAG TPA: hypothetical protein PLD10_18540 [Rhodopila sp.]|nr:hypothetical protein [Rhodopila sp.]
MPSDTLQVGGKSLFMSFGLLHELLTIVGDIPRVAIIAADDDLRKSVLNAVLAERDQTGAITTPANFFTLNITAEDVRKICAWVGEHCLDFFIGAIETAVEIHKPQEDRLKGLENSMPSGLGIPA